MDYTKRMTFAIFLGIICAILFVFIAYLISKQMTRSFDHSIILFIQGFESPNVTSIMKFFTYIGSTTVVATISIIILFVLYKVLHHRIELILFISVVAGSAILNQILKHVFHRPRPMLHRLIEVTGFSFPSGHSMEAMALYSVLAFLFWRHMPTSIGRGLLIIISACMILAIGVSRIYLGVHYPSDVIAGYLASGFWFATAVWIYQYYMERSHHAQNEKQRQN